MHSFHGTGVDRGCGCSHGRCGTGRTGSGVSGLGISDFRSLRCNNGARDVRGQIRILDSRCTNSVAGLVLINISIWLSNVGDGVEDTEV